MRKIPSKSEQSVSYNFPSLDCNFSCTIFSYNSEYPSVASLIFKSLQYLLGFALSERIATISTTEKNHFSSCQTLRTLFPSNNAMCLFFSFVPAIKNKHIALFEGNKVRRVWHDEKWF